MNKLLFLIAGPSSPPLLPARNRYHHLSQSLAGVVLHPTWWGKPSELEQVLGAGSYPCLKIGHFTYWFLLSAKPPNQPKLFSRILFYLRQGRRLIRTEKLDTIVAYGTNTTGFLGVVLKKLTKIPLIIEVPGVPVSSFVLDQEDPSLILKMKRAVADWLLRSCLKNCDAVKLLYPDQLSGCPKVGDYKSFVFHDFVPISDISPNREMEDYLLFVGYPWFLKGLDLLLSAFRRISPDYPGLRLIVLGFETDSAEPRKLAEGLPVEFRGPTPADQTLRLIEGCRCFVLPSRTEAMGRVLLEAMAARRPIVASRVDGIPHYIKDGENGLLFESGNASDLEQKIRNILSSPSLAKQLAYNGYDTVHLKYSEKIYVSEMEKMVAQVVTSQS